ncbi:Hypothetical predicted protein [Mytilus galloprovincialis]|uniref:C-type lectin domain-containing protein n=1 Tax=Mytilus galloprovincialis TaxID=29158 RepID=A0A8B6GHA1_MYTGA|nr:Hypothetical predicted protein [Mytilus galloprovincialis]
MHAGKKSTFTIKSGETLMSSSYTTDVYSKSKSACAAMCVLDDRCCVASFSEESSICRYDRVDNCCVATDNATGWSVMTRNQYISMPCTEYIHFGVSSYYIFEEHAQWETAKGKCGSLRGKLAELETFAENQFIKDELQTRNTGVNGYWIGGYNFHNDNDMEWVSQPDQPMTFSDMGPNQPDKLMTEICMVMWKDFAFRWGDFLCHIPLPYICEFMHQ